MVTETQPETPAPQEKKLPWWIWIPIIPAALIIAPILLRLFMVIGKELLAFIF